MSRVQFQLLGIGICMLVCGCAQDERHPAQLSWLTMGTVAAVQSGQAADVTAVRDLARETFDTLEHVFSTWTETSELARVNATAGGPQEYPCSRDLGALLVTTLDVTRASDGAFNPLVGAIMRAWGFNGAQSMVALPSEALLREACAQADWKGVQLRVHDQVVHVRLDKPGMRLDLGGIAKGYAVDRAFERVKAAGYTNALIDLGGNLRATGEAVPGRGGWRVGIRNPFEGTALVGTFLLHEGEATATSGNYERFVEIHGVRYSHIMDARTGYPVRGMAGVTILAPTAVLADALSTTLFVLGPERGAQVLALYPGCEALWIPDDPAALTVLATPGFAERLTPAGKTAFSLRIIQPFKTEK